jgi:hypothetical protein
MVRPVDAQRSTVRGELLDVEQAQPVRSEHATDGEEGEVGEVLVVDGVPLSILDQPQQMGKLHRDGPAGRQQDLHAADEVVQVGDMGENVVTEQQVSACLCGQ